MSESRSVCPHGADTRTATCGRCADPAFDAAQQPIPSNQAGTASLVGTGVVAPPPGGSLRLEDASAYVRNMPEFLK
jgi:hypothetical protein